MARRPLAPVMRVVIVGDPHEASRVAIDQARDATAAILDLETSELAVGELVADRIKRIAKFALTLAKAYAVIDSLACDMAETINNPPTAADDPAAN